MIMSYQDPELQPREVPRKRCEDCIFCKEVGETYVCVFDIFKAGSGEVGKLLSADPIRIDPDDLVCSDFHDWREV